MRTVGTEGRGTASGLFVNAAAGDGLFSQSFTVFERAPEDRRAPRSRARSVTPQWLPQA
jgi:hypothetical protein